MPENAGIPDAVCPSCGKRGKWNPALAGKKLKCKCGATFDAPELTAPLPTLDYRHPDVSPRSRADRISVEDPWEGNKAKNLFLPIILIVASVIVSYLSEQYAGNATPIEPEHVWMDMGLNLATQIPAMLLACWVAMHWLDTTFGPVGPAILKLCSIALSPDALWGITTLAGMLWGHSSGSGGMIIGSLLGAILGWGLGLALYFGLFVFYFSLEFSDAMKLTFLIWVFRVFGSDILIEIIKNHANLGK